MSSMGRILPVHHIPGESLLSADSRLPLPLIFRCRYPLAIMLIESHSAPRANSLHPLPMFLATIVMLFHRAHPRPWMSVSRVHITGGGADERVGGGCCTLSLGCGVRGCGVIRLAGNVVFVLGLEGV